MATQTTNLNLVKPDYTDAADIAVINSNMDIIDTQERKLSDGMCYVVNGNKSIESVSIPVGSYVRLVNSTISGRSDGIYTVKTAIPVNTVINNTYLNESSPIAGGVANSLNSKIDTFVKSKTFSITTTASGEADINATNLGYLRSQCLILAVVTNITTGDTVYPIVGVYRGTGTSWTIKFQQGNSVVASKTFNITVWYVLL